ncbi:MAG TPA: hypothetical protein VIT65_23140 [Microlunatus sp.]
MTAKGNRLRKRCMRRGHRWGNYILLPFQFCQRWRCDGTRVNPDYPMPEHVREEMQLWVARQEGKAWRASEQPRHQPPRRET